MADMYKKIKKVKKEEPIKKYNWEGKTILVSEDTETSNMYFKAALKKTYANTIWTYNGKEAVEKCKENENIDLILMDIRMPEMDGITATKKIKKLRPDLPIIMQTAYFYNNEKERGFSAGCIEFLTKPIKLNVLLKTIDKYIS